MKVEVLGSQDILDKLERISNNVSRSSLGAVSARTASLHKQAQGLLSSGPREGIEKGGRSAGTGKQVGPPGQAAIGIRSGRLLNSLTSIVSTVGSKAKYSGEIGFPTNFVVANPGKVKRYALNWPRKNIRVSNQVNTGHTPARNPQPSTRPVSQYAQEVILGTHKIAGRNILRMIILDDINKSSTVRALSSAVREALKGK